MRNFIWRDFFVTSWFISGMPSRSNRPWQLVFLLKLCRWAADSRFFQENPIAMWSFGRYSWQHLVSTASGVSWERHQFSLLPFRRAKQRVMGLLLLLSDLSDIIVIVCYSIITISILLLYIHIHIYIYIYSASVPRWLSIGQWYDWRSCVDLWPAHLGEVGRGGPWLLQGFGTLIQGWIRKERTFWILYMLYITLYMLYIFTYFTCTE